MKKLFKRYLPLYVRFWPSYVWLAAWSAPTTPAKLRDYFAALRVTIRRGEGHSEILYVAKRGMI